MVTGTEPMKVRTARKYPKAPCDRSAAHSGATTSRARGPHTPMQQVPPVTSRIVTPASGRCRVIQSRSSGPLAPTWKTSSASRATVRSLRTPPFSSSISV